MRPPRLALLVLAILSGCSDQTAPPDSALYVRQLQPLLTENGLLAERLLDAASEIHDERATPQMAATTWRTEITPLAVHLHDQALRLDAPSSWATSHQRLVDIWGERATGYALIGKAMDDGDPERWRRGRAMADQAKLDEETWFSGANQRLAPGGMNLDQYP